jgi:hypothetical protein
VTVPSAKHPPPLPDKPRNRRVFLLLLALGLLIPGGFIVWRIHISWSVHSRLKALRQAGYPTTMVELEQMYYPKLKPEDNAATVFLEAFQVLDFTNSPGSYVPIPVRFRRSSPPFDSKYTKNITDLLARNHQAMDILTNDLTGRACHYPLDFSMGFAMPMRHLIQIKEAASLFVFSAVFDADDNRPEASLNDLDSALRLSRSLNEEPFLISHLVQNGTRVFAASSLEHILNQRRFTDPQLTHLSQAFQANENPSGLERALVGELCMGDDYFQMSAKERNARFSQPQPDENGEESKADNNTIGYLFMDLSGFTGRDFDYFLDISSEHLRISREPFPQRLDSSDALAKRFQATGLRHLHLMSGMLLGSLSSVDAKECDVIARMNIIQAVIAIERYRLANEDRLPEALADLIPGFLPSVPTDPFDGHPLRFKKLSRGYMVYSIGRDRRDDGGVERTSKSPTAPEDITFTVER